MSISVTTHDSIAVITMAHGKANAMDVAFFDAFRNALDEARPARAVVLTAAGSIFSAGVDLPRVIEGDRAYLEAFLTALSDGLAAVFTWPKPVVAAINGHALAGGAILAWACDYRVMVRGAATIGVPELRVGVPFPLVAGEIVRHALGSARAGHAMLVGHRVPADRAVEEGFVDETVDPAALRDRALAVATNLAATVPASFAATKADLTRPMVEACERGRAAHDRETLDAWDSNEVREAIREFVMRTIKK